MTDLVPAYGYLWLDLTRRGCAGVYATHKYLYLAHCWSLGLYHRPLVDARIEAWGGGPMFVALYPQVVVEGAPSIDSWLDQRLLDSVLIHYQSDNVMVYAADAVWYDTRRAAQLGPAERGHAQIRDEDIFSFYSRKEPPWKTPLEQLALFA